MPVLSIKNVLDCFYLLIFYSEKFSTDVCRLLYAVNVNLNLSNNKIINNDNDNNNGDNNSGRPSLRLDNIEIIFSTCLNLRYCKTGNKKHSTCLSCNICCKTS